MPMATVVSMSVHVADNSAWIRRHKVAREDNLAAMAFSSTFISCTATNMLSNTLMVRESIRGNFLLSSVATVADWGVRAPLTTYTKVGCGGGDVSVYKGIPTLPMGRESISVSNRSSRCGCPLEMLDVIPICLR